VKIKEHKELRKILDRIPKLAPITFIVPIHGTLAVHLMAYAHAEHVKPEVVIAEALRVYLGDV
jgi:hypothetical protein